MSSASEWTKNRWIGGQFPYTNPAEPVIMEPRPKETWMKVKIFSERTSKKESMQLLEDQINAWLAANPNAQTGVG
jgi:hypothetical protein